MAHASDPRYSGGRDKEDRASRSALGKQFPRPYLGKNHSQQRAGAVAQGEDRSSNPSTTKKKTKQNKKMEPI
jgi:hypothetical protein